jgi:hypothetical protein
LRFLREFLSQKLLTIRNSSLWGFWREAEVLRGGIPEKESGEELINSTEIKIFPEKIFCLRILFEFG